MSEPIILYTHQLHLLSAYAGLMLTPEPIAREYGGVPVRVVALDAASWKAMVERAAVNNHFMQNYPTAPVLWDDELEAHRDKHREIAEQNLRVALALPPDWEPEA